MLRLALAFCLGLATITLISASAASLTVDGGTIQAFGVKPPTLTPTPTVTLEPTAQGLVGSAALALPTPNMTQAPLASATVAATATPPAQTPVATPSGAVQLIPQEGTPTPESTPANDDQ